MKIDASQLSHQELNDQLRMSREQNIIIDNCLGQRYLASGSCGKKVTVTGTPGNALGSYLDGTEIDVYPWQRRRRHWVCHAGREDPDPGRYRLPGGGSYEGIQG